MANEFVKVTEHYGYYVRRYVDGSAFVVFRIASKKESERIVSAFKTERRAKQECRYLEGLNYGGK